jgi:glutaconyl-CoA decarboxylase
VKKKSNNPLEKSNGHNKKSGKLLDRFKIRVSEQEFTIEIYNQDLSDENFKKYSVVVNGTPYTVEVESIGLEDTDDALAHAHEPAISKAKLEPKQATSPAPGQATAPLAAPVDIGTPVSPAPRTSPVTSFDEKTLTAPMPGKILEIKTKVGDSIEAGQPLVILEAMKMENVMPAPTSGIVKEIPIKVGMNVNQGDKLVIIE